ncbi:hypothetical protein NDA11_005397 [Ustilago hordei]|uniref:Uncharacterized protein n=1 Tax=Ustilago hordei TaxID=120017 RepID=I2FTU5_USTHO|nr:uncharacterized protein UHO2_06165 [Ustilago hordei]KAJ1037834.1 hypothetical protein NDA10_004454 [Ustilago hordei]KAJ1575014.1 hypothetical protein NDA15_004460 [Ustilago hordei]KAJ1594093.1 hypothetical protein NDA12_005922 [Ustilago hordei]KAJ1594803.1 hypothetical protein NDA11_005397 [Ustilago hordei]KAJ1597487.1 hypothetical protein NDA14_001640 [Ustilago hordei]
MPSKNANVTQVTYEGVPVETILDRLVLKPESPIEAGSPSIVRGNKRKLSGLGNPQFKKGKNQSSLDSDSSESSSSESDSDSDSDFPQIDEPSKDIDQLSKLVGSLEVREAAMESAQANSTASLSAGNSPTTTKSCSALPPKDPFLEVLDWAAQGGDCRGQKGPQRSLKN